MVLGRVGQKKRVSHSNWVRLGVVGWGGMVWRDRGDGVSSGGSSSGTNPAGLDKVLNLGVLNQEADLINILVHQAVSRFGARA